MVLVFGVFWIWSIRWWGGRVWLRGMVRSQGYGKGKTRTRGVVVMIRAWVKFGSFMLAVGCLFWLDHYGTSVLGIMALVATLSVAYFLPLRKGEW